MLLCRTSLAQYRIYGIFGYGMEFEAFVAGIFLIFPQDFGRSFSDEESFQKNCII